MRTQPINISLALAGGVTIANMIAVNSKLATFSSPLLASWIAHGVGALTSFAVLMLVRALAGEKIYSKLATGL